MRRRSNPDAADRTLTKLGVPPKYRQLGKVAAGLLVLGVVAYFSPDAYNRITYGPKKGEDAAKGDYLHTSPAAAAGAVGVPVEIYSLARGIRSEAGSKSEAERIAV